MIKYLVFYFIFTTFVAFFVVRYVKYKKGLIKSKEPNNNQGDNNVADAEVLVTIDGIKAKESEVYICNPDSLEKTSKIFVADELVKLKALKDSGILSEEEFQRLKAKLLSA